MFSFSGGFSEGPKVCFVFPQVAPRAVRSVFFFQRLPHLFAYVSDRTMARIGTPK